MSVFQEAMAHALLAEVPNPAGPLGELLAQPGFAVYRNTVLKGCIDALEANFPTVARLVGRDWFRSVALAFVQAHPPADSRMLTYGDAGFAAFLQAVPTAADLPYLAGVARLDSLWRAAHVAADAPVLPGDALDGTAPHELSMRVLHPHPATQWAWFDEVPVAAIWSHERAGASSDAEIAWVGDGLLFTRHEGAVHWQSLSRGGCAWLDACAAGACCAQAAERAFAADATTDPVAVLHQLLQAGAFTSSFTARSTP